MNKNLPSLDNLTALLQDPATYPRPLTSASYPMPRFWCECQKCHGKEVGKTAWYKHNPEVRQRQRRKAQVAGRLHTTSGSTAARGGSSSNMASGSGVTVDAMRYPTEEVDLSGRSMQAARSETVCIKRQSNLCATIEFIKTHA